MKKNPYKLISVIISAILIICIMPFNIIYADSNDPTYYDQQANEALMFTYFDTNYTYMITDCPARSLALTNNSSVYLYSVVDIDQYPNAKFGYADGNNVAPPTANRSIKNNWISKSDNGHNYKIFKQGTFTIASNVVFNVPLITDSQYTDVNRAFYYTYGDGAVDPEPPIQAGVLSFNYYTDFASNQQNTIASLRSNRDTITWDYDTTDSNIPGIDLKVDIRAVPSKYYASTEDTLKSLDWNDLSLDIQYSADLGTYQMNWNNRKVSYTWGEVVDKVKLNSNLPDYYNDLVNSWNFKFIKLNDLWYWTGWVYQIRLNTWSGDYTGEWQTIYQVSSAPPEGSSQTINYYVTNGTGVTEPIYQTIQNINNQNNITNNTWYVNGSPYSIDNDNGQNWWETLLQFISDLVSTILSFLGSIFDSVINGVLELVNNLGINFLEVFSNLINRIVELFGNIDLTGQNYLIPEEYTENLNKFNIWTTGLFNVFINSGLGLFVLIPFILLIVRLFI